MSTNSHLYGIKALKLRMNCFSNNSRDMQVTHSP